MPGTMRVYVSDMHMYSGALRKAWLRKEVRVELLPPPWISSGQQMCPGGFLVCPWSSACCLFPVGGLHQYIPTAGLLAVDHLVAPSGLLESPFMLAQSHVQPTTHTGLH